MPVIFLIISYVFLQGSIIPLGPPLVSPMEAPQLEASAALAGTPERSSAGQYCCTRFQNTLTSRGVFEGTIAQVRQIACN